MTQAGADKSQADYTFGQIAIRENLCTFEQVKECLDIQNKLRGLGIEPKKLGEILIEKGHLNAEQVAKVSKLQTAATSTKKVSIPGYEILSKIGQGAMGSVYKAKQVSMDRIVAVKIMAPRYSKDRSFVERFLREARAVAKLNHENIIGGIDVGETNGLHYFVMEYVDGIPVTATMKKDRRIEERRCLEIALQTARALSHAHKHGIVHRDIKPENIMITREGVAKLCDLGLAKQSKGDAGATMDGTSVGTPNYISPEQARGEENIDIRTDIYSLGASLYHMATGTPAFSGANPMVVMTKHVTEFAEPPHKRHPGLSQGFSNLVMKMMGKRREDRPQTPNAVMADIEALLSGGSVAAPSQPAAKGVSAPSRAHTERRLAPSSAVIRGGLRARSSDSKMPLFIGLGVGAVILIVLVVMFSGGGTPPPPQPKPPVVRDPNPGPRPVNPNPTPRPVSKSEKDRIRTEISDFHALVDSQLDDESIPDRFTRPYAVIQNKIQTYRNRANFAGEKAWRDELLNYTKKINTFISDQVWSPIKASAEEHLSSSRYSKALGELDKLAEVYKWLRVDTNPPEMTEAGKAHKALKDRIDRELNATYLGETRKAGQLFGVPAKRDEAYRLLDALAASMASKRNEIEAKRADFFALEMKQIVGPNPAPAGYSKALQRIDQLKKLHPGNTTASGSLDRLAADIRSKSSAAASAAASKAAVVYRTEFKPKFEAALKFRNLGGARNELNRVCHAPELAAIQSTLLAFWGDRAVLKSFLNPKRKKSTQLAKVVNEAEQAFQAAAQAGDEMARDLAFDIRTAALLEEFMEQAIKGAEYQSRESRKFQNDYSPALSPATAASALPRGAAGEIGLNVSATRGGRRTTEPVYLAPRKGAPPITEDDIVQLAQRSYASGSNYEAQAERDPYFALRSMLLHVYSGRLSAAKSAMEKLKAPQVKLGVERFSGRLKNVTSEAMELAAQEAYEDAWKTYHLQKNPTEGAKKFTECAEKFGKTQYMQERTSSGKSRIDVVREFFGGGASGNGQPMGAGAAADFGTSSVRSYGNNRYEITYRFRTDEEVNKWKRGGDGNVQAQRDEDGVRVGGEGIWYLDVPFKGDVELEVSFTPIQGQSMGFILHGEDDRSGYVQFVDLPLPGQGRLDAMFRLPIGEGLQAAQAIIAQGGTGLALTPGTRQSATFRRRGSSLRFTLDRGELTGDHAGVNQGRVGIVLIKAAATIHRVRVRGEVVK